MPRHFTSTVYESHLIRTVDEVADDESFLRRVRPVVYVGFSPVFKIRPELVTKDFFEFSVTVTFAKTCGYFFLANEVRASAEA